MSETPKKRGRARAALRFLRRRWWAVLLLLLLIAGGAMYVLTSESTAVWPVRNTLLYRYNKSRGAAAAEPPRTAALEGCVRDRQGQPLAGAQVLLSERDGALHQATTDAAGCYALTGLPSGRYVPLAGTEGYETTALTGWGGRALSIGDGMRAKGDFTLPPLVAPEVLMPGDLQVTEIVSVTSTGTQGGSALRREVRWSLDGRTNQLTYLYTPVGASEPLPTLLAIYPGPADQWETVSIPLAAAGYAVIAIGPEYSLDLDRDIAELRTLVALLRSGALPGADGGQVVILGGSYSSLHVQRLLLYDTGFAGAILLGPIVDIFEMRLLFEQGTFFPPFGLDEALIAMGYPSTEAARYERYSSLFHLRSDHPPLLLMHSRTDEVVSFTQSERLNAALAARGVHVELHIFDGMSHYLRTDIESDDVDRLYAITTDFLDRALKPMAVER